MNKFEYTSKRIKFKSSEIQTYTFGSGKKVILSLPGFATPGIFYLFFTSFYNHKNFKIITFDVPGWGGLSDNIFKDNKFSIDECVEIAEKVLEEYRVKTCNIIGYSYRGAFSLRF
ncbi:MAG: hypothetical protein Q9M91_01370 [Candidatus Dojkabacteria bacterium]|nr:hypothetical protein [Candidatus Dojkabacteria bacterium]MDQ7020474.1 hypothetical protein [Candidatus Dojkabacteria bacterium]